MTGSPLALASAVLALLLGTSCAREPEQAEPERAEPAKPERAKPESPKPEPEVETPAPPKPLPTPELPAAPEVPLTYDDGAFSVRGLREDFDAQIANYDAQINAPGWRPDLEPIPDKEILVRAWVVSVYTPPPGCGIDCPQAHVRVADGPTVEDRGLQLLVGAIAFGMTEDEEKIWADEPKVVLEVGKQYLFKGIFKRMTSMGFEDPRGVLEFIGYRDGAGEWILPPAAPWHPKTIEMWAAEDAAMMEKMKRDAARLRRP
jgi:hypothetical protein